MKLKRNGELPFQTVEEETVVVNPKTREVHVLNTTGARIWDLLATEQTLDELCATLEGEFEAAPGALRDEVTAFVRDLGGKDLISERAARAR
jgi:hypothetical protein